MTSHDADDAIADGLSRLSRLTPDPGRAERLRRLCRERIERDARREAPRVVTTGQRWPLVAPVVVGGVCVLYALALVVTTLRLEGILR